MPSSTARELGNPQSPDPGTPSPTPDPNSHKAQAFISPKCAGPKFPAPQPANSATETFQASWVP
eukprot:6477961-Alexandrium_andersonii.AAC.1